MVENKIYPKDVEAVFFKAAERGWAVTGTATETSTLLPGYKLIRFKSGKFSVLDAYCVNPASDKSAGFTTIWCDDVPVWTMHYSGRYQKRLIPLLKLALQANIISRTFVGGRGPTTFTDEERYPDLVYINNVVRGRRTFSSFAGREIIVDVGNLNLPLGYHDYRGISLL
ncbi:hypothetical protein A2442_03090 [Candidatus Campbellbacteria bacterium RIFOXYC2_FULL_35_25]|uniref:DUF5680 domain-containing protein n=1 Tax=Candidatus Campbellbacteria bacterium RIFOXYC2_FULL_35_25 TaxID=1797582 RepID=A0A1F5EJ76_9BACT|nr:MAG: hypothetical protein A2442_03090 [Candidatus Campbellbacteria bacterium RIFOXYC2_FULL_35_25]